VSDGGAGGLAGSTGTIRDQVARQSWGLVLGEIGWVGVTIALDVKAAAERGNIDERTVYQWARAGLILARRLGRGRGPWRVLCDELGPVDAHGPGCQCAKTRTRKGRRR